MQTSGIKQTGLTCTQRARRTSGITALRAASALTLSLLVMGCAAGIKGRADPPDHIANATNQSVYADQISNALDVARNAEKAYCRFIPYACVVERHDQNGHLVEKDLDAGAESRIPTVLNDTALRYHRNTYLYEMMRAHELALQDYGRSLSVEGRGGSFFSYLVNLGLVTAAGISKVQETARVLNVLAGGALGVTAGYDETVLLKQTLPALLDRMETAQSKERKRIVERMSQDVTQYPISAARHDIARLGEAATIDQAVTSLVTEANKEKEKAKDEEDVVRNLTNCTTEFNEKLRTWFGVADKDLVKKREDDAIQFFKDKGSKVDNVTAFVNDCRNAALQKEFVKQFKIS